MKKFTALTALAAAAAMVLSASAYAKTYTIRVGTYAGPDHPVSKSVEYFKENIERESNGQIKVVHFPNNQLGPEAVVIDQVKRGIAEFGIDFPERNHF